MLKVIMKEDLNLPYGLWQLFSKMASLNKYISGVLAVQIVILQPVCWKTLSGFGLDLDSTLYGLGLDSNECSTIPKINGQI